MKKIFSFIFIFVLILAGCSSDDGNASFVPESIENSDIHSDIDISKQSNEMLLETAKQLIESDKLVTELFVGGMLAKLVDVKGRNSIDFIPAAGSEYEDFYTIEKLLTSTYSVSGGTITKFLTFPKYGNRSILSVDGKTYFTFHYTENLKGIDTDSITLSDGSSDNEKIITAGEYTVSMVYDGSAWLLEDSIYFLYKEQQESVESELVFPSMNKGSAAALSGKILVAEIFVSEKKTSFTDEKKENYLSKIEESFDYISKAAEAYEGSFTVDYKQFSFTHKTKIDFALDEPYAFDFVLAETSYENLDKYIKSNIDILNYDGYLVIICADKAGRGYAQPYVEGEPDVIKSERCVLFSSDDTAGLTKNILTLFGAEQQTDEYQKKLMESYCKNEIMTASSIQEAVLSELTAYQVGLTKQLNRQFYAFADINETDESKTE